MSTKLYRWEIKEGMVIIPEKANNFSLYHHQSRKAYASPWGSFWIYLFISQYLAQYLIPEEALALLTLNEQEVKT